MPLSITVIEKQLEAGRYQTMTDLEQDLKRMVQNAKDYNSSKSEVFDDAERIRKALSNFMPKHNPAYLDPEYRAVPTPIPDHLLKTQARESSASGSEPPVRSLKLNLNPAGSRRQSQAQIETEAEDDNLEDTQLEMLDELSTQENAINFEEKPSKREIPHYYKVIERPTSISDVRGMVEKGKIGSWNDFAKEVRLIWANAKEYNEPGSEIYTMAEELETWFDEKLKAQGVAPKAVPRLSLKTRPQPALKLKLGTPTTSLDQWKVDGDALERQKAEMASALEKSRRGTSRAGSTPGPAVPSSLRRSMSVAEPNDVEMTGVNGTKADEPTVAETAKPAPPVPTNIPTPVVDGEPPRLPVKPPNFSGAPLTNGFHQTDSSRASVPSIYAESNNPIERKFRDPGKGLGDALLESVTYMTHPQMPNDPKWKISRYASPTKTQTASYIYLPHNHYYLRVIPNLSSEVKSRKRHKLCVAHNWQVQPASPGAQGGGVYDFRLQPGENVIVVDVIADLKDGEKKDYAPPQLQLDFERVTFYVILRDRDAD